MPRFRRITSSGTFIPEIDGLRFAAVVSVVLYHLHGFLPEGGMRVPFHAAIDHGYRGVNLFYVISGFVLGLPFASHYFSSARPVSLKNYFVRRLTRLEPPYILNLLICFGLLVLTEDRNPGSLLPHLGASVLYVHNLFYGAQSTINPVAWTLEVEVQFYCLVPLLAVLYSVRSKSIRRTVFMSAILVAGLAQMFYWDAPARAKFSILYAIQFFFAGLMFADLYVADWNRRTASNWRWDLCSLVCWPLIFLPDDRTVWVLLPYLMLLAYIAVFRGVLFKRIFTNPAITVVGGMCYTIYLFHYQLIPLIVRREHARWWGSVELAAAAQATLYLAALAIVSCAYFLTIERPCMAKDWPLRVKLKAIDIGIGWMAGAAGATRGRDR